MVSHKEVMIQKFAESLIEKNGDEVLMNIMRDYKGHIAQKDIQKAIQHMEANDYAISPFMKKLYKHFNNFKQNGKSEIFRKIFERINTSLSHFYSKITSRIFDINPADAEKYNSWLANFAKVAELSIYYHPIDWTSSHSVYTVNHAQHLSPEWFEENRKVIEGHYCKENSHFIPDSEAKFVEFCNKFNFVLTRRDMYKAIVCSCFASGRISRSEFILLSSCDRLVDNMFNAFGNEFFDVYEEIVLSCDMRDTQFCGLGRYLLTKYDRSAIYQAHLNSLEPSEKLELLKQFMGVSDRYSAYQREYDPKVIQLLFKSYGRKLSKSFVEKLAKSCGRNKTATYLECCEILCGKGFMAVKS